ncbi:MAG TPA: Ser-Thr-rich GPI-anchored membrane family protein [Candidatus Syntrophosphaera sp.]|nr:Ser-Thr-rich GPI-anchored membrane family protein [Candidatus Syntrophosphaera sp.]
MKRAYLLLSLLALICLLPAQNSPLALTAPNGGEVWTIGSTYNITWTQTNLTGNVSLTLLGQNSHHGPNSVMIAEAVPVTDLSYAWTIPATVNPGTNYRVRISMMQSGMWAQDVSDAPFTIVGGTPPPPAGTLTLTAPNGGEEWAVGSTQNITWTSENVTGNVNLQLMGQHGAMIAEDVLVTDGTYAWTIPNNVQPGTHYRVRIFTQMDPNGGVNVSDVSDAEFTITGDTTPPPPAGTLTLTAPNGGEEWAVGSVQNITWTSENVTGNVNLQLMGHHGIMIAEDVPVTDGTFAWTIPDNILPGTHYRVCIFTEMAPGMMPAFDVSDADFTITGDTTPPPVPNLVLTSPNGGETWQAGTTQPITWTFDGSNGFVILQLLGGPEMSPINPIAMHVPAMAGTYNWHIPPYQMPLDAYKVKISLLSSNGVSVEDESDGIFVITAAAVDSSAIAVTAPNGGEEWAVGTTQNITWTADAYTGCVRIFLLRNADRHHHNNHNFIIAPNVENNGTFAWTIPANLPLGSSYKIMIKKVGSQAMDSSDGTFSIVGAPTLLKASPNPTRQGTEITFETKAPVMASVRVYNIKRQCVRTLVDGQILSGKQNISWDGNDRNGLKVSAGIYFARISSPEFNASQKIIVLK